MKKLLFVAGLMASCALLFTGCKKDDDVKTSTHQVQYVVEGSANVNITSVTYTNSQGDLETKSNLSGQTWTSETITIDPAKVAAIAVACTETTTDNKTGTLVAKIIVDGKTVKENPSEGNILQVGTSYGWQ